MQALALQPQTTCMQPFFQSSKAHVRLSGLLEGISYLVLLLIAMPLKYWAGMPETVRVVGMAHGVLFVWYVIAVLVAKAEFRLSIKTTALALFASLVPFGTFYADAKIFKQLPQKAVA